MKKNPKVSIIIPLWVDEEHFYVDLQKFSTLTYKNFELLIVCDWKPKGKIPRGINAKVILTGQKRTGPAEKRDMAIAKAKGEICAFIDDDAYPHPDWLENAVIHFQNPHIAAVGGPGVTPKEDEYLAQLTGLVYGSFFCGGHARHRFVPEKKRHVVDYPAYNLFIRKDVLEKVGGYGNHFYGGEDTFLCLKIIKKGWKILYDPKIVVYHHRRPLFVPYLRQIANIGKHRGYFAKKFPETSRTISYFIPSFLTTGFFSGIILSLLNPTFGSLYIFAVLFFVGLGMLSVIRRTSLTNAFLVSIGIILTHLTYGVYFMKGLLIKKLVR